MTQLFRIAAGARGLLPPGVFRSLRSGGLVVFPTDTLYGLGADPGSAAALEALFSLKGREEGKPVPLLLDSAERAWAFAAEVPEAARRLMERFWPGALTIVLPASPRLLPAVAGPGRTVGLRVPDHPVPRALAKALGGAVTGTSANRSGSPARWQEPEAIAREFAGRVEWILWDGPSPAGREGGGPGSTVVSVENDRLCLLREGEIPFRSITDHQPKG
ncbi:MAG TPA: threonylcarbamoyl-AMP synthase [Deltaproteobacteria bacterium]|nr:threonylcarbamoyl-AMP synthase [Deltaproteobacteria bacterium]